MSAPRAPVPRRLVRAEQVLAGRTRRATVVLEGSQDPHNVHAVLRTAEALGVQDVHLVAPRGEAGAIAPGVTQRAHDWLTVVRHEHVADAAAHLKESGYRLLAMANEEGARSLTGLEAEGRVAILLGNETDGLTPEARAVADDVFRIDLVGFSGSLNLSVAAAIAMWELRRESVTDPGSGDLDVGAQSTLRQRWYSKLLGHRAKDPACLRAWLGRAPEIAEAAAREPRCMPRPRDQGGG